MRGSASVIPNLVTVSTGAFIVARITRWWIERRLLFHPLPELAVKYSYGSVSYRLYHKLSVVPHL